MKTLLKIGFAVSILFIIHGYITKRPVLISYPGQGLIDNILEKQDVNRFLEADFTIQVDSFFTEPVTVYSNTVEKALTDDVHLLLKSRKDYYLLSTPLQSTTAEELKKVQNSTEYKQLRTHLRKYRWLPCTLILSKGEEELKRQDVELHVTK